VPRGARGGAAAGGRGPLVPDVAAEAPSPPPRTDCPPSDQRFLIITRGCFPCRSPPGPARCAVMYLDATSRGTKPAAVHSLLLHSQPRGISPLRGRRPLCARDAGSHVSCSRTRLFQPAPIPLPGRRVYTPEGGCCVRVQLELEVSF
jgi:hypothetical protein